MVGPASDWPQRLWTEAQRPLYFQVSPWKRSAVHWVVFDVVIIISLCLAFFCRYLCACYYVLGKLLLNFGFHYIEYKQIKFGIFGWCCKSKVLYCASLCSDFYNLKCNLKFEHWHFDDLIWQNQIQWEILNVVSMDLRSWFELKLSQFWNISSTIDWCASWHLRGEETPQAKTMIVGLTERQCILVWESRVTDEC